MSDAQTTDEPSKQSEDELTTAGTTTTPARTDGHAQVREPAAAAVEHDAGLEMILDVAVTLTLEVGRAQMTVRELLQLDAGSVVELDRLAGEPMDVLVNGTLVAHGEVVVVDEKFGIRISDIITPEQRVKRLN